ncbi:hypothetical protein Tco_0735410 [Tanacetum coccineum]
MFVTGVPGAYSESVAEEAYPNCEAVVYALPSLTRECKWSSELENPFGAKEVQINDTYVGVDVGLATFAAAVMGFQDNHNPHLELTLSSRKKISSSDASSEHIARTCQANPISSEAVKRAAVRDFNIAETEEEISYYHALLVTNLWLFQQLLKLPRSSRLKIYGYALHVVIHLDVNGLYAPQREIELCTTFVYGT